MKLLAPLALAAIAGRVYAANRAYLARSVARDLTDVEDYAVSVGVRPAPAGTAVGIDSRQVPASMLMRDALELTEH